MSGAEQDPTTVEVEIRDLRRYGLDYTYRDEDVDIEKSETLKVSLPGDALLSTLWHKIEDAGFRLPKEFSDKDGNTWKTFGKKTFIEPFDEVKVVEGVSTAPDAIGLDETFIAFTNRYFGTALQLNIDEEPTSHGSSSDCLKDASGLKITFLRTTRMPDDDKFHPLPDALGAFHLHRVDAFAEVLPDKIVREGGVFLPMWQREALWIGLDCETNMQYALRVYVGRINAISGREMKVLDTSENKSPVQDYVVVPSQHWLDGICVGPGVVRQFVAMPLGSGYTVEGQKTSEEKHGGLQIEIIPAFKENLRTWLIGSAIPNDPDVFVRPFNSFPTNRRLDERSTPRELGLDPGTRLRVHPCPIFKEMQYSLSDIDCTKKKLVRLFALYPSERLFVRSKAALAGYALDSCTSIPTRHKFSEFDLAHDGEDEDHESDGLPLEWTEQDSSNTEDNVDYSDNHHRDAEVKAATKNLKSMGLAAGGKLMQDIIEDPNPAEIWNTAASRLVNIHILDPASFEAVTHIVPAPPSIDVETYAKSNLPFFVLEEKLDERLDGGDFDNVKSVSAMDREKGVSEEQSLDPKKPTQCKCGVGLCDCVVRPCNHTFCHICIKEIDPKGAISWSSVEPTQKEDWKCPICQVQVAYVAGFSTPMNLPGEQTIKMRVPVNVLEVRDGRPAFKSVHKARV